VTETKEKALILRGRGNETGGTLTSREFSYLFGEYVLHQRRRRGRRSPAPWIREKGTCPEEGYSREETEKRFFLSPQGGGGGGEIFLQGEGGGGNTSRGGVSIFF